MRGILKTTTTNIGEKVKELAEGKESLQNFTLRDIMREARHDSWGESGCQEEVCCPVISRERRRLRKHVEALGEVQSMVPGKDLGDEEV